MFLWRPPPGRNGEPAANQGEAWVCPSHALRRRPTKSPELSSSSPPPLSSGLTPSTPPRRGRFHRCQGEIEHRRRVRRPAPPPTPVSPPPAAASVSIRHGLLRRLPQPPPAATAAFPRGHSGYRHLPDSRSSAASDSVPPPLDLTSQRVHTHLLVTTATI
ncbi:serine/arginine repetitive matrix protein 1-like [Zingiber officinale]|uniref:serine/arginine repetitive matrix protein 1-like n=1 Tax=Zingiber officinale TaxID=94328 RepID=UPI001C4C4BB1|nr:serine/arginine repetitive matrix protein 1-like [Zingiber officinale]